MGRFQGRSRAKPRRSGPATTPQRQTAGARRQSTNSNHAPKRVIRVYKNQKLDLQTQKSNANRRVEQGIPHPRHPTFLAHVEGRPFPAAVDQKASTGTGKHSSPKHEISDVPTPTPATAAAIDNKGHGFGYAMVNAAAASMTQLSLKATPTPASVPAALKGVPASKSFSPLPPLPSFGSNRPTGTPRGPTEVSEYIAPLNTGLSDKLSTKSESPEKPKMGVPAIVMLSVTLGSFVLGLYLLFRFLNRRRRIGKIKPSLPRPETAYSYDENSFNREGKESPVFGGKERSTSSRLGVEGPLWTWVQYAKPDLKDPNRLSSLSQPRDGGSQGYPSQPQLGMLADLATGDKRTSVMSRAESARQSVAMLSSKNRMSTASLYRNRESREVPTAITGDGYPILERSRSKLARRSQSYSVLAERRRRDSAYRVQADSAYDGADVSSPTTYFQPMTTPNLGASPAMGTGMESRERIQSSYYAVAPFPRFSSMPPSYSIGTARKVHLSNAYASERRNNGEDAVPQAPDSLYVPDSPGATLYPDDSMSVIAAMRHKRCSQVDVNKRQSKHIGIETASTKGLLEMEFGVSRMSISELAESSKPEVKHPPFQSNLHPSNTTNKVPSRAHDKPPRVPSPPPMPSLAQMALAHGNPEGYGNYRSPTYSIYGLYGNDRKGNATTAIPLPSH